MEQKCVACGKRVPWVCFCGNTILAFFKVFVGYVSGSKGLVADGFHSGADVIATIMVLLSLSIAARDDDETHPWGHGKIEFAGALLVYAILFLLSIFLFIDAVGAILSGDIRPPHLVSFVAAAVSIIANYILSGYGFCAGKHLNSPAMIANANENKADMLSSFAVVFGIIGANMGFVYLDAVAAILVALIIFKTALTLGIQAVRHLLDESLPFEKTKLIKEIILGYKEVRDVSFIKTRRVGQSVWVDLEIMVSPNMNVQDAHVVTREIRLVLIRRFKHIKDVVVTCSCKETPFPKGLIKGFTQEKFAAA